MTQATGPSLEKKVLVFEELEGWEGIGHELERGGLHSEHIVTTSDYTEALAIAINPLYYIVGALFHCCLEERVREIKQLHSALRKRNLDVEIYHVGGPGCNQSLIDSGIVTFHIQGILPMHFGGPAEENLLCQLGYLLQEKYFTPIEEVACLH